MNQVKKLSRKERARLAAAETGNKTKVVRADRIPNVAGSLSMFLAVVAFLLYLPSVQYDFTHDDFSVIKENTIVSQGAKAIPTILKTSYRAGYMNIPDGLYRPLSLVMFSLEWSLSPDSPALHHLINVLLYAFTAFFLFQLLRHMLPAANLLVPASITLIFIFHPVHTEIVASIKSRDELLSFLFSIVAILFLLRHCNLKKTWNLYYSLAFVALALFSKETGIVLLGIIPFTLYFFSPLRPKQILLTSAWFVLPVAVYLLARNSVMQSMPATNVVSGLDNFIVDAPDYSTRLATAFNILAEYLWLLVFPVSLISDYSSGTVGLMDWSQAMPIISVVLHMGLIAYCILRFKSKDPVSYCIIFYLISIFLFSNIALVIGTPMAERFLYVPSFAYGFALMLVISGFFPRLREIQGNSSIRGLILDNKTFVGLVAVLICLYSIKTLTRSSVWRNNEELYSTDVVSAPKNYRLHYYLGRELTGADALPGADSVHMRRRIERGIAELEIAKRLTSDFPEILKQTGVAYFRLGAFDKAEKNLLQALAAAPNDVLILGNLGAVYGMQNKLDEAEKVLKKAVEIDPFNRGALLNLANNFEYKGDIMNAKLYREKAERVNFSAR